MHKNLKIMLQVAMLVAIEVVLNRFCSINTQVVKIGFAFVPVAVCAMLFGPIWACITAGMADFIGAILFPIGPYFPGFTASAALTGLVFGLLLYKRQTDWKHIALAVGINNLIISLFLTTFWIHLLYGGPYWALVPARLLQNGILVVVEFAVIRLLQKPVALIARHT